MAVDPVKNRSGNASLLKGLLLNRSFMCLSLLHGLLCSSHLSGVKFSSRVGHRRLTFTSLSSPPLRSNSKRPFSSERSLRGTKNFGTSVGAIDESDRLDCAVTFWSVVKCWCFIIIVVLGDEKNNEACKACPTLRVYSIFFAFVTVARSYSAKWQSEANTLWKTDV